MHDIAQSLQDYQQAIQARGAAERWLLAFAPALVGRDIARTGPIGGFY